MTTAIETLPGSERYARAIEVQPDLWSAQRERGLNLMRLGDKDGARAHLARAFRGHHPGVGGDARIRARDALAVREVVVAVDAVEEEHAGLGMVVRWRE